MNEESKDERKEGGGKKEMMLNIAIDHKLP